MCISAGASALLGALVIAGVFLCGWLCYGYAGFLLDPTYPALAVFALVGSATLYIYRSVEQQRAEVRRAFGHYVSPAVVDELIANPRGMEYLVVRGRRGGSAMAAAAVNAIASERE